MILLPFNFDHTLKTYVPSGVFATTKWSEFYPGINMVAMPYKIPYNCKLVGVNFATTNAVDFHVEVYLDSDIEEPRTFTNNVLAISGNGFVATDLAISGGRQLGVYFRFGNTPAVYPYAELLFESWNAAETQE